MKRNDVIWMLWLLFMPAIIGFSAIYGQVPSRDHFVFSFENTFEDNKEGRYLQSDYSADWNSPIPGNLQDQEIVDILSEKDTFHKKVMRAYYDSGTFGPSQHGILWKSYLKKPCRELYFSYDLRFKAGFNGHMGGKLPGLTGGKIVTGIYPKTDTAIGLSVRPIFRKDGVIVMDIYYYDQTTPFGNIYDIPGFKYETGKWYNITLRVVINTFKDHVPQKDGILEVYINGKLYLQKKDFKYLGTESIKIDNQYICSFFGGSTDEWSAKNDEWIDFDNFVSFTYSDIVTNIPRGNTTSSTSRVLLHPYHNFSSSTDATVPSAPLSISSTSQTKNTISLKWTDNSDDEEGFKLYRSMSQMSGYHEVITLSANTSSYTDNNSLVPGTIYYYKLIAYNQNGNSPYSPVYQVSTKPFELPASPSALSSPNQTSSSIVLNWKDNSSREQGFELFRSTSSLEGFAKITTLSANAINFEDSSLQPAIAYYYKLRAYNQDGFSEFTTVLEVSTMAEVTQTEPETPLVTEPTDTTQNEPVVTEPTDTTNNDPVVTEPEVETPVVNEPVAAPNYPPIINDQQFTVAESGFSNSFIGKIASYEPDGQDMKFSIVAGNMSGLFVIDSKTGNLKTTTNKIFGPGTLTHMLVVEVSDDALEPKSVRANIKVILIGQSSFVYINPGNTNDMLANGSIDHPFDSWSDVTWKEGYTYLQKKGTTAIANKILIGANKVSLGAYGEGESPVISSQTNTYLVIGFEKSGIKIKDLNLQAPNAVSCIYFLGNSGDSIIVEHCELYANANAVKVVDGNALVVKYNTITSNHEGIYSTATSNEIYYNIFKSCNTAINVMSISSKANIYNNVFFDNEKSLSVSYAELTLYNNIFYMTTPGQTAVSLGTGNIESDHNIFYPEQTGFITIGNTQYDNLEQVQKELKIDMNSFNSDPLFIDIYNENFSVQASSPAINGGIDMMLGMDFAGSKVPQSGAADIGVTEFSGPIIPSRKPKDESVMTLYPNPSSGQFNIIAEIKEDMLQEDPGFNQPEIQVVDISGNIVFAKRLDNQSTSTIQDNIDVSGISNGLYFVVLRMANEVLKEKLILTK